jgi:NADH-quinone oxidoreductase subunit J
VNDWIFIIFVFFSMFAGLGVVFSKNPVYSAFNLVLCFIGLSGVYLCWGATFIAMVQILIYTGAILVLFLFVVMLLDLVRGTSAAYSGWMTGLFAGAGVWVISLLLLRTLNRASFFTPAVQTKALDLRFISKVLFNEYLWPFEVLSVFLLAMIISVYILTRPERLEAAQTQTRELTP